MAAGSLFYSSFYYYRENPKGDRHYVSLSTTEDQATWEAFCQYDDKFWSYTDCSLLIMASRLKVPYVVAFDEHIRQMSGLGIIRLP